MGSNCIRSCASARRAVAGRDSRRPDVWMTMPDDASGEVRLARACQAVEQTSARAEVGIRTLGAGDPRKRFQDHAGATWLWFAQAMLRVGCDPWRAAFGAVRQRHLPCSPPTAGHLFAHRQPPPDGLWIWLATYNAEEVCHYAYQAFKLTPLGATEEPDDATATS